MSEERIREVASARLNERVSDAPQGRLIRGIALDGAVRFVIAETSELVASVLQSHRPSPQGGIGLSRVLTAVGLLTPTLKNRHQIGLQINGDGPLREIYCVGDSEGRLRITVMNPEGSTETDTDRLAPAIGKGRLTMIKTLPSGEPYRGVVPLESGEIAEDLSAYFLNSEQSPSACGLGERLGEPEDTLAAGYLIQALPDADDLALFTLETRLSELPPITELFQRGGNLREIAEALFDQDYELLAEHRLSLHCDCERPRIARILISLGVAELERFIEEDGEVTLNCHFCMAKYHFSEEELRALLLGAKARAEGRPLV